MFSVNYAMLHIGVLHRGYMGN